MLFILFYIICIIDIHFNKHIHITSSPSFYFTFLQRAERGGSPAAAQTVDVGADIVPNRQQSRAVPTLPSQPGPGAVGRLGGWVRGLRIVREDPEQAPPPPPGKTSSLLRLPELGSRTQPLLCQSELNKPNLALPQPAPPLPDQSPERRQGGTCRSLENPEPAAPPSLP